MHPNQRRKLPSKQRQQHKPQRSLKRSISTHKPSRNNRHNAQSTPILAQRRLMSAKKLTVVLNQDYEELGKAGDLVAIKPGRARNHLLPKGIVSYDTPENRQALAALGVKVNDVVIDKEEELKAAATRPYSVVLGDVVRNIGWTFNTQTISSADNHIAQPITKRDLLMRLRKAKFHFVTEDDIVLTPGYEESGLNHCGIYPVAVAMHCVDQSDWAHFNVTINRVEQKQKIEAVTGDANAV